MTMNARTATAAPDQITDQMFAGGHQMVNSEKNSAIPDKKPKTPQINRRNPAPAEASGFQSNKPNVAKKSKKLKKLAVIRLDLSEPLLG